jgi:gluconate 2-dehydrogenase gamma chain
LRPEDFVTNNSLTRRRFLSHGLAGISATWLAAHWPGVVSAAEHARKLARSPANAKFEFFSPDEGAQVDSMAARIIPTDDTPGAREAGVVYFIDRALATFAADDQEPFRKGISELQVRVQEMFPGSKKFPALTPEQQDEVLRSFDQHPSSGRPFRPNAQAHSFFQLLRGYTITGFLVDPEAGGNRDAVGWKLIGREEAHSFQPPFGYYDEDYPGWQADPPARDKPK